MLRPFQVADMLHVAAVERGSSPPSHPACGPPQTRPGQDPSAAAIPPPDAGARRDDPAREIPTETPRPEAAAGEEVCAAPGLSAPRPCLDGEPLAPFRPAAFQHVPPAQRLHPPAKAVRLLAPPAIRLKRS